MKDLQGKTSDRIRSGEIPADSVNPGRQQPQPSSDSMRNAAGQGLGQGAVRSAGTDA